MNVAPYALSVATSIHSYSEEDRSQIVDDNEKDGAPPWKRKPKPWVGTKEEMLDAISNNTDRELFVEWRGKRLDHHHAHEKKAADRERRQAESRKKRRMKKMKQVQRKAAARIKAALKAKMMGLPPPPEKDEEKESAATHTTTEEEKDKEEDEEKEWDAAEIESRGVQV